MAWSCVILHRPVGRGCQQPSTLLRCDCSWWMLSGPCLCRMVWVQKQLCDHWCIRRGTVDGYCHLQKCWGWDHHSHWHAQQDASDWRTPTESHTIPERHIWWQIYPFPIQDLWGRSWRFVSSTARHHLCAQIICKGASTVLERHFFLRGSEKERLKELNWEKGGEKNTWFWPLSWACLWSTTTGTRTMTTSIGSSSPLSIIYHHLLSSSSSSSIITESKANKKESCLL